LPSRVLLQNLNPHLEQTELHHTFSLVLSWIYIQMHNDPTCGNYNIECSSFLSSCIFFLATFQILARTFTILVVLIHPRLLPLLELSFLHKLSLQSLMRCRTFTSCLDSISQYQLMCCKTCLQFFKFHRIQIFRFFQCNYNNINSLCQGSMNFRNLHKTKSIFPIS